MFWLNFYVFYFQAGHLQEAIQECSEVLKNQDENDVDVLCDRAEAYLLQEDWESGKK